MSVIEKAISWAVAIAQDDSHGYDQINRWGVDYDCSSLIISAFQGAGVPVKDKGATYTGNMKNVFSKCGFEVITYKKGMALIRGDVLLNEKHHTALYLGSGQIVQASINEMGRTTGGRVGDQTGKEIKVCPFYEYSKGWECVLRYTADDTEKEEEVIKTVNIQLTSLSYGSKGEEVKTVQRLLNALGAVGANGKPLTVDGVFGDNVVFAVNKLQQSFLGYHDGTVGQLTWTKLLKG